MRVHGTRACYVFGPDEGQGKGCRCEPCRAANREYARTRERRRANPEIWGEATDLVPASEALEVMEQLLDSGIGIRAIAQASGLNRRNLMRLARGGNGRVKASTVARLRAVTALDRPAGTLEDAAPTWAMLEVLIAAGYPKARLARLLGAAGPALQIRRTEVRASTARKVEALYARLWFSDPEVRLAPGAVPPLQRAA